MCNHDKKTPKKQRHGSALEHGQAHAQDHQAWSRRTFLQHLGVAGTASFLLGSMPLTAITSSPLAMALTNNEEDRILVLIRLKGGNDALNMIVPIYDYGTYQFYRNNIAIPENQLLNLSDELGMPNTMEALNPFWQEGAMKVVNNVGYPNQNLSHFRSTDIWASASDANVNDRSGWLGRLLENEYPDFLNNPPEVPPAIQIGGSGNIVFNDSDEFDMSLNVANPEQLYEIAQTGQLYDPQAVPDCHYGDQLSYLRVVANNTFRYAEVVAEAFEGSNNSVEYGNYSLANQLALVARLIRGGLGTRLYMVTHDGFDTHANQNNNHPALMNQLAEAVSDFYTDLEQGGHADRVLGMTFSEFGRRLDQNASNGTDHGGAASLLVFGSGLNGNGVLGGLPDLQELDTNGNLQYTTDFRQIYATVLEQWLCIDPMLVDQVMGDTFERLGALGLVCSPVNTWSPSRGPALDLQAYYHAGQLYVNYDLPTAMPVDVTLYNMLGQPLKQVYRGNQFAGHHEYSYPISDIGWAAGIYVCTLRAGNQQVSRQIRLVPN